VTADIGLFEAIYTARSLRHFKPDPVPQELITKVLDAAIRASSGGNTQHWTFLVVRDAEKRRQLGAIYRQASDYQSAVYAARPKPEHLTEAQYGQFLANSGYDQPLTLAIHDRDTWVRTWNDINGNRIPDCDLTNFGPNGECQGLNNPNLGGSIPTSRYDPSVTMGWGSRPYNWEVSAGIGH